jgi:hypothetical protein
MVLPGKLSDIKVRNAKPGVHGDGGGLYLREKPSGAKSWVLRVQHGGKREDIGLGGYPLRICRLARRGRRRRISVSVERS